MLCGGFSNERWRGVRVRQHPLVCFLHHVSHNRHSALPHIGRLNERIGTSVFQRAAESSSLTNDGRLSNIASKTWAGPVG